MVNSVFFKKLKSLNFTVFQGYIEGEKVFEKIKNITKRIAGYVKGKNRKVIKNE